MKHDIPDITTAVFTLALGGTIAMTANAADTGVTRGATTPAAPARSAPPPAMAPITGTAVKPPAPASAVVTPSNQPAVAPVPKTPPTVPLVAVKSDYAIGFGSQEESENTALAWRFRIENRGPGEPSTEVTGVKYGFATGSKTAALVISVGAPCPNGTSQWTPVASLSLPSLKPGASIMFPSQPYRMPDGYAGKGCRFKAEIKGPANDANLSNNAMQMITKSALLPDLVLDDFPGSLGGLDVVNVGKAPSEPSKFHFECTSKNPDVSCGTPHEKYKSSVVLDVPVPALNPKQRFTGKKSTPGFGGLQPKGVAWKAYADHANSVAEGNEGNNTRSGGK